jgi:hypothetical protein
MIKEALYLEPENLLYKWGYYTYLDMSNTDNKQQSVTYAKEILGSSPIKEMLRSKGALGEYILGIMDHWSKAIIT